MPISSPTRGRGGDGAVAGAPEAAASARRRRPARDAAAAAPAPAAASPRGARARGGRGRGATVQRSPTPSPIPPRSPSASSESRGRPSSSKRSRRKKAASPPPPPSDEDASDSDSTECDHSDDDPEEPAPRHPLPSSRYYRDYWEQLNRRRAWQTKPTARLKREFLIIEARHRLICSRLGVDLDRRWHLAVPCPPDLLLGMGDVDDRFAAIFYGARAKHTDGKARVAQIERDFFDPNGPGPDILQKVYGLEDALTARQYRVLRRLWKVDTVLSEYELVIEAVVLRPFELYYRWKGRREKAEIKRYTGHARFKHVGSTVHAASVKLRNMQRMGVL
jgi:hypothetical protein